VPAKDRLHDAVVRALRKDGWSIKTEQAAILLPERRLWIDIQTEKKPQRLVILVEVKGFEHMPSPVEYLAGAVGKYALYRAALDYLKIHTPLYMAVPILAYNGILSEEVGKQTLQRVGIKLIVFDPELEEIVAWIE